MATTTMPSHLTKLTVPQLKVLCKERKLTGYSKLAKPALLQKLTDSDATTVSNGTTAQQETSADSQNLLEPVRAFETLSVTTATQVNVENHGKGANTLSKRKHSQAQNSGSAVIPSRALPLRKSYEHIAIHPDGGQHHSSTKKSLCPTPVSDDFTAVSLPNASTSPSVAQPLSCVSSTKSSSTNHPGTICASSTAKLQSSMPPPDHVPVASKSRKRPAGSSFTTPSAKKTKTMLKPLLDKASAGPPGSSASSRKKLVLSPCNVPCRVSQCQPVRSPSPSLQENRVSPSRVIPNTVTTVVTPAPGKRFKPLVINKKVSSAATPRLPVPQPRKPATVSSGTAILSYLDFSPTTESLSPLTPIGLPPSISHRKRVHTWAIILSGLNDNGRRRCVLVSKMFRYAVYLSAGPCLQTNFGGGRLDAVLRIYPQTMTNLWPYLRLRRSEVLAKQRLYSQSFLSRSLEGKPSPISQRLWGSPDSEKQLVIALRFVMTRFWFALSLGGTGSDDWLQGMVVDTNEVVPGEIWSVKIQPNEEGSRRRAETLYVLEATCEVVGCPPAPRKPDLASSTKKLKPLRADWSAYIQKHIEDSRSGSALSRPSVLSQLKWANYEEYNKGISRLWLQRIAVEGELGIAKRTVAFRYILACVISNGVSGPWQSTAQMVQDFAGLPSQKHAPSCRRDNSSDPAVNLYLPAHHHIESVHFSTSDGRPLHPALAVVQTPDREYYILKDNGMEVGCEEDGVASVWMDILRCDRKGLQLA